MPPYNLNKLVGGIKFHMAAWRSRQILNHHPSNYELRDIIGHEKVRYSKGFNLVTLLGIQLSVLVANELFSPWTSLAVVCIKTTTADRLIVFVLLSFTYFNARSNWKIDTYYSLKKGCDLSRQKPAKNINSVFQFVHRCSSDSCKAW